MIAAPKRIDVPHLALRQPEQAGEQHDADQRCDRFAVARLQPGAAAGVGRGIGRHQAVAHQQRNRGQSHAAAGRGKAPLPVHPFAQRADEQRAEKGAGVEAGGKNGEGRIAATIVAGIEMTGLRVQVAAQRARAECADQQAGQEGYRDHHHHHAGRGQHRTQDAGEARAPVAIAQPAAQKRGEEEQAKIKPHRLGSERLQAHRAEQAFQQVPPRVEAANTGQLIGREQEIRHVKDEQRLHAIDAGRLQRFRHGDDGQAHRMACESARFPHGQHRGRWPRHPQGVISAGRPLQRAAARVLHVWRRARPAHPPCGRRGRA